MTLPLVCFRANNFYSFHVNNVADLFQINRGNKSGDVCSFRTKA